MKPALLFSGGLDSVCALHLLGGEERVVPVYVAIGGDHEARECEHALRLAHLRVVQGPLIGRLAEPDGHIRHRNAALVVTVAAHGYEVIYLGALRGEASPDKSSPFMRKMAVLLTESEHGRHVVAAPFGRLTKTDLLRRALDAGLSPSRVLASRSCYRSALDHCGACQGCFRRWVALVNCGLPAGYLPDLPGSGDAWRHLRRAGVRRWPDLLANNLDAARAVLRWYGRAS